MFDTFSLANNLAENAFLKLLDDLYNSYISNKRIIASYTSGRTLMLSSKLSDCNAKKEKKGDASAGITSAYANAASTAKSNKFGC